MILVMNHFRVFKSRKNSWTEHVPGMEEASYLLLYLVDNPAETGTLGTHKNGIE
jgi:hypothetical protein